MNGPRAKLQGPFMSARIRGLDSTHLGLLDLAKTTISCYEAKWLLTRWRDELDREVAVLEDLPPYELPPWRIRFGFWLLRVPRHGGWKRPAPPPREIALLQEIDRLKSEIRGPV